MSRSWFYLTFESNPPLHLKSRLTVRISKTNKEAVVVSMKKTMTAVVNNKDAAAATIGRADNMGVIVTKKARVTHIVH